MSEDIIVGRLSVGGSATLVFSVNEWRGKPFACVRKFVLTQKYEGPTKSGLVLNKNLLYELILALAQLEKTIPPQEKHEFKRIPKTDTEYIKIETMPSEEIDDLPAVDVREFVDTRSYQGPTKRGIRLRWNLLPDVIACLREQAKVIGENEKNKPSLFEEGSFSDLEKESKTNPEPPEADGIAKLLDEDLKQFPDDFIEEIAGDGIYLVLPDVPLRLEQDNAGAYQLKINDEVYCAVRNQVEANFIIYTQMCGHKDVTVPKEMIHIFKTVKAYENYARTVQTRLVAKVLKIAGQRSVAEYEVRKKMSKVGLPRLKTD